MNKRFGEDWARLTKDLLFDSEGSLKFKPELWNDIRKVILPQIIDKVMTAIASMTCHSLTSHRSAICLSRASNIPMKLSISWLRT